MKIVVAGGSGLLGTTLIKKLVAAQHEVINLTTNQRAHGQHIHGAQQVYWNPSSSFIQDIHDIVCDAVVNLAGYSISNRWTKKN